MTRRRLALLALATAWTLVVAHAALAAVTASFSCSPSCEVPPGTTITFTSTSNANVVFWEWDLDGDGLYGSDDNPDEPNGTSETTAQRNFPTEGTFTVGLRVTEVGNPNSQDTETKTITVSDDAPPPPPPPPPPDPPPPPNQPPNATIDFQCDELPPGSQALICPGLIAIAGKPKIFNASPSSDPDGTIVKYEWDFNNDGTFEKTGPVVKNTFPDPGGPTFKLRVTDDDGATDVADLFAFVQANCQAKVTFKRLTAKSECFKRTVKSSAQGFGKIATYKSSYSVNVNGLIVTPASKKSVKVTGIEDKNKALLSAIVKSENASVYVKVNGAKVLLHKGALSWAVQDNGTKLGNFKLPKFNGLKVSGLAGPTLSSDKVSSKLEFYLALPGGMGGATSSQKEVLTPGKGANAAAGAFSFKVENASIGPIGLKKLTVAYDGDGLWEIAGKVALPAPIPYQIAAGLGIDKGEFSYGEAEIDFGSPGIGPFGPIFLNRIKFRIELKPRPDKPSTSKCVPKIGIEHFNMDQRFAHKIGIHLHPASDFSFDVDHGIPNFALCGEVGLTAGPEIGGLAAIRLDAGLGFATYPDRPAVMRAFGKIFLVEIPLAQASFEVHSNGYTKMRADFNAGIDDIATIEGFLKFEMYLPKFNAEAFIEACVGPIDLCAGARALISSKGIAVCLRLPLGWEPGVGYVWGGSLTIYWAGCEVGPYREYINASAVKAAGAEQAITIPQGLPGTAISATGQRRPPEDHRDRALGPDVHDAGQRQGGDDGRLLAREGSPLQHHELRDPEAGGGPLDREGRRRLGPGDVDPEGQRSRGAEDQRTRRRQGPPSCSEVPNQEGRRRQGHLRRGWRQRRPADRPRSRNARKYRLHAGRWQAGAAQDRRRCGAERVRGRPPDGGALPGTRSLPAGQAAQARRPAARPRAEGALAAKRRRAALRDQGRAQRRAPAVLPDEAQQADGAETA